MKSLVENEQQSMIEDPTQTSSRPASPCRRFFTMGVWLLMLVSIGHTQSTPPTKKPSAPAGLRQVLVEQLRTTHNKKNWFVPVNAAIAGLTPDQARWVPLNARGVSDGDANHSVGMIANHLLFYNRRALALFKHENSAEPPKDNEETFNRFDAASWKKTVEDLDHVLLEMERFLEQVDDATLAELAPTVANISTHNAYHTGQILYVRKLQGSWNPDNGVK